MLSNVAVSASHYPQLGDQYYSREKTLFPWGSSVHNRFQGIVFIRVSPLITVQLCQTVLTWCSLLGKGGLPPGAETGYVYDWLRQRQRRTEKEKKRKRKLRKKISKLARVRKKARPNRVGKIKRTVENAVKRLEEEKRHLEGIK
jgi:hypothetical protein